MRRRCRLKADGTGTCATLGSHGHKIVPMRPAHRSLLLLALGVFVTLSLEAQTVTEEIEVRVINVDVIVTNRSGAMVPDLTVEDFQLFEDGKPIEIKYFSR